MNLQEEVVYDTKIIKLWNSEAHIILYDTEAN